MLLTISTDHRPATDLGYLLHKHPDRFHSFDLSFGQAHVFYSVATETACTACLLIEVDPVGMVRGTRAGRSEPSLVGQYVNDRPYVASSFVSVALAQVFRTALAGRCDQRPELVMTPLPWTACLSVLPARDGADFVRRLFEPLGYEVQLEPLSLDEQIPEWGDSPYFKVTIRGMQTLAALLAHLYVLIPVFDNTKHYFVGPDEMEKLLAKGDGWLASHPEKDLISRRYLGHRPNLFREALARLVDEENLEETADDIAPPLPPEDLLERPLSLNDQRHGAVLAALRASGARSVLDLGCGEGKLLRELLKDRQFERIVGLDVSIRALEIAQKRLKLDWFTDRLTDRLSLLHGSLMYRDKRLEGFDAAAVVEVIEHLDPPRLTALERVLFECARPKTVVLTTPNQEYNVMWETLPGGQFRHADHRFEWTRQEFQDWAQRISERYNYSVRFLPVGPVDPTHGSPTQFALFQSSERGA